jgi:hypothetical protein
VEELGVVGLELGVFQEEEDELEVFEVSGEDY